MGHGVTDKEGEVVGRNGECKTGLEKGKDRVGRNKNI
jgi:hypothetical protein